MTLMKRASSYGSPSNSRGVYSYSDTHHSYGNINSNGTESQYSYGGGMNGAIVDDETGAIGMRRHAGPRPKGRKSCVSTLGIMLAFVLTCGYSLVTFHERKMMKNQLAEQETVMRELEVDLSMKYDTQVKTLKNENASLQRKASEGKQLKIANQSLKDEKRSIEKTLTNAKEEVRSYMHKNEILSKSKTSLINNVQRTSKEAALSKFGPGPYRLEMHLRFDSHLGRDDGGTITIELAPLEDLPHAVHLFLEQVSRKLYDGFSFYRNAGHVLQAAARRNFLTEKKSISEAPFKDAGYHSLLFPEYADNFPHRKYTLGFAGSPAGPSFYINLKDNSQIHGPGGQRNRDDPSEAETCFAKVIDGFDLVERMLNLPVQENKDLKANVAIASIRLKTE